MKFLLLLLLPLCFVAPGENKEVDTKANHIGTNSPEETHSGGSNMFSRHTQYTVDEIAQAPAVAYPPHPSPGIVIGAISQLKEVFLAIEADLAKLASSRLLITDFTEAEYKLLNLIVDATEYVKEQCSIENISYGQCDPNKLQDLNYESIDMYYAIEDTGKVSAGYLHTYVEEVLKFEEVALSAEEVQVYDVKPTTKGSNVNINREKRVAATVLGNLGATLIVDDNKGTKVNFWEYRGNYIIESECWEDGSGPCAYGNCLDHDGRRGMKLQEISVKCAWFCFHRTHCRLQTCCPFTNKRPHTNGGNPSTGYQRKYSKGWLDTAGGVTNLRVIRQASLTICEEECTKNPECIAYTYITSISRCDLKDETGIGGGFVERDDLIAGLKSPDTEWDVHEGIGSDCWSGGYKFEKLEPYPVNDEQHTLANCKDKCAQHSQCQAILMARAQIENGDTTKCYMIKKINNMFTECTWGYTHTYNVYGKKAVDGGWSDWGEYGECSEECGGGKQTRMRTCTNPAPQHGGLTCDEQKIGDPTETMDCNIHACGVVVLLESTGQAAEYLGDLGYFDELPEKVNERPAYAQRGGAGSSFIFHDGVKNWLVSDVLGKTSGFLYVRSNSMLPPTSGWFYPVDGKWRSAAEHDSSLMLTMNPPDLENCNTIHVSSSGPAGVKYKEHMGLYEWLPGQWMSGRKVYYNGHVYLRVRTGIVQWSTSSSRDAGDGIASGRGTSCPSDPEAGPSKRVGSEWWGYVENGQEVEDTSITVTRV